MKIRQRRVDRRRVGKITQNRAVGPRRGSAVDANRRPAILAQPAGDRGSDTRGRSRHDNDLIPHRSSSGITNRVWLSLTQSFWTVPAGWWVSLTDISVTPR